jgi:uncharacterized protein
VLTHQFYLAAQDVYRRARTAGHGDLAAETLAVRTMRLGRETRGPVALSRRLAVGRLLLHSSGMEAPPSPRVTRPVMFHQWTRQAFLHWRYRPDAVQQLLPPGLEVETFDGDAWVGLVPFLMRGVRAPGVPPLPWASTFPETNVRTYVRGRDGQSAIWFLSLDAARLPAVLAARATYWLPYYWSEMAVEPEGSCVRYRSRRRWPGPHGANCRLTLEIRDLLDSSELGPLDHFLTARHVLYAVVAGRLVYAHAEHPPWPLARAHVLELEEDLVAAGGLSAPEHSPLVHYSPGVSVRIGLWKPVPT